MSRPETPDGLVVLGFGGHARSIADVALSVGITQLIFLDDNARPGETFGEYPVLKTLPAGMPQDWQAIPASGDNARREQQVLWALEQGWKVATLVSPTATLGYAAILGKGVFIAHHAHIGPCAEIGDGCIVNTAAVVEHEVKIGSYTHLSVNTTVAGRSKVGDHCFIAAGATVIDGLQVGDRVTLGAGACAVRHLSAPGTYLGVPARLIDSKQTP